jgi:type I restriction enzyme, R subunit
MRTSSFSLQPSAFRHVRPISDHGNVNEIVGKFGGADQLRNAVNQLQSLLYAA